MDAGGTMIDACTLNNALNVVQLAILLALLKWVRNGGGRARRGQVHYLGERSKRPGTGRTSRK